MPRIAALFMFLALWGPGAFQQARGQAQKPKRPHIIFIMADDVSQDDKTKY